MGGISGGSSGEIKIRRVERPDDRGEESSGMIDSDKQLQELRKEVVEARNLVIKNDNLLKTLHGDVKKVLEKQEAYEKRSWSTSATAFIVIGTLAALGAYMFASAKGRSTTEELAAARSARHDAETTALQIRAAQESSDRASKKALAVFDGLAGDDESARSEALNELSKLDMKKLTPLEQQALEDKSRSLRLEAARDALDDGRNSLARHDWKGANESLTRYLALATHVDDAAYLLLGQARLEMHAYNDAADPLQKFLKDAPNSKQADYATLMLGDALASAGKIKEAVDVYRSGGSRFYGSQYGSRLRAQARRFEKMLRDAPPATTSGAPAH